MQKRCLCAFLWHSGNQNPSSVPYLTTSSMFHVCLFLRHRVLLFCSFSPFLLCRVILSSSFHVSPDTCGIATPNTTSIKTELPHHVWLRLSTATQLLQNVPSLPPSCDAKSFESRLLQSREALYSPALTALPLCNKRSK